MAIILRGYFSQLAHVEEWKLFGDLLDIAANFPQGRGFVFDGLVSCVEEFPNPYSIDFSSENVEMTYEGASLCAKFLLKFVFGSYGGDVSMSATAFPYLERVYEYMSNLILHPTLASATNIELKNTVSAASSSPVPDEDLWRSVCHAFCIVGGSSNDPPVAKQALESMERMVKNIQVSSVSDNGWLFVLDIMTARPPIVVYEDARIQSFHVLCTTLLLVLPELSQRSVNWKVLTHIIRMTAKYASENLRVGRMGRVSRLFETTVEKLTNATNVLSLPDFSRGTEFCQWAADALYMELEKVGAAGGCTMMVLARTKRSEHVK